jgi:hypothetical protein
MAISDGDDSIIRQPATWTDAPSGSSAFRPPRKSPASPTSLSRWPSPRRAWLGEGSSRLLGHRIAAACHRACAGERRGTSGCSPSGSRGSAAKAWKSVGTGGQSKAPASIHGSPSRSALAARPLGSVCEVSGTTSYQEWPETETGPSRTYSLVRSGRSGSFLQESPSARACRQDRCQRRATNAGRRQRRRYPGFVRRLNN